MVTTGHAIVRRQSHNVQDPTFTSKIIIPILYPEIIISPSQVHDVEWILRRTMRRIVKKFCLERGRIFMCSLRPHSDVRILLVVCVTVTTSLKFWQNTEFRNLSKFNITTATRLFFLGTDANL